MKLYISSILIIYCLNIFAQDGNKLFEKAMQYYNDKEYAKAISLFSQHIELNKKKNKFQPYYYRAMSHLSLKQFEKALNDVDICIKQKPKDMSVYTIRAFIKKSLTQYECALQEFNAIIKQDPYNMESYYNRGILFTYINKDDSACMDFKMSKNVIDPSKLIFEKYCKTDSTIISKFKPISSLTKTSLNKKYGYDPKYPVKVGTSILGAAASEHIYLDLLRDENYDAIIYERVGKCCPYKSASNGIYYLDKFDVTYKNAKNKTETNTIYITHEEFEEPQILYNLKTINISNTLMQQLNHGE